MTTKEPGIEDIEQAVVELLRDEEIGAVATVGPSGAPATAMMHFAADGLTVYLHTFTYTRKYAAIQRDPRVSYTTAHVPPDGFAGRMRLRATQVDGIATVLTKPAEIDRAIEVSREQFARLRDTALFDTFKNGAHTTKPSSGSIPSRRSGTTTGCACSGGSCSPSARTAGTSPRSRRMRPPRLARTDHKGRWTHDTHPDRHSAHARRGRTVRRRHPHLRRRADQPLAPNADRAVCRRLSQVAARVDPMLPILGGISAIGAVLFALNTNGRAAVLSWIAIGLIAVIIASSIIVAEPINSRFRRLPEGQAPDNAGQLRVTWRRFHYARTLLALAAFTCLVAAVS